MKKLLVPFLFLSAVLAGAATGIVQNVCGPFTDVSPAYCPYVLEMYYLGITVGTSPTTYSPDNPITRGQAAVFVSKGVNQAIARSSRRAALGQWWSGTYRTWESGLATTTLPDGILKSLVCDGSDVWVAGQSAVYRVRASDGKFLDTWSVPSPYLLLAAIGRVFAVGGTLLGDVSIYMIDPSGPAGPATAVATLSSPAWGLSFDGSRLWTVNLKGSVSIITPSSSVPWAVTTVALDLDDVGGIVFDGRNMWVSNDSPCKLSKLDFAGGIVANVDMADECSLFAPVFDGANVLVPAGNALKVVRVSDGTLAATIPIGTGAERVAFDGERILVESDAGGQNAPRGMTLLRAADFSVMRVEGFPPIGSPGANAIAADGINFWLTFGTGSSMFLARY